MFRPSDSRIVTSLAYKQFPRYRDNSPMYAFPFRPIVVAHGLRSVVSV